MARTKTSTKCKVCNRTVRYDSTTFPYCNYHAVLKHSSSTFLIDSDRSNLAEARKTLYNPERSARSAATESVFLLSNNSKVKLKTVAHTYKKWNNLVKDIDIYNPQQMFDNRDRILSDINDELFQNYDTEYLSCDKGKIHIPDQGLFTTDNHRVLYVEDGDGSFVVDGATPAPLHTIFKDDIDNHFDSGTNTCGDGLYISGMFEFNKYTSIKYNTIKGEETGEVFGTNLSVSDDKDIRDQKRLIEHYGYDDKIAAQPIYLSSATDWQKRQDKENNTQDPETVEDVMDML